MHPYLAGKDPRHWAKTEREDNAHQEYHGYPRTLILSSGGMNSKDGTVPLSSGIYRRRDRPGRWKGIGRDDGCENGKKSNKARRAKD